jgi:hypothetical protein
MTKLRKVFLLTIALVFMAGSAMAYDPSFHVKVAPNGKGDVLIFPWYATFGGGWETKITVVNTDEEHSTVAKLIVRSMENSQELLDFLIYLSPADVWTGTLRYDTDRGPVMYSTDDSAQSAPGTFASTTAPLNQPLVTPVASYDTDMMGYVYVINSATWMANPSTPGAEDVEKVEIKDWYDSLTTIPDDSLPQNILAGWMDLNVSGFGLTAGLRATALRDYVNTAKLGVGEPTFLGSNALNNLYEVETVLSKTTVAMPYLNTGDDLSLHFFTFPTKYTNFDEDGKPVDARGPYWNTGETYIDEDFCIEFTYQIYDLEENTVTGPSPIFSPAPPEDIVRFCREVDWTDSSGFPFEEGWIRYTFSGVTTDTTFGKTPMTYTGAPVIPTMVNLGATGMSLKYGAWSDGEVSSTIGDVPTNYLQYHYSDTPNTANPQ